eukprot:TRINITY_DN997_c0_g1_i2.p3 TRINITY_DN997_c0_g1~~TRINITY_DN997_c0_g1_i2.p3  ORF type:complete len:124 (-),score=17.07 TRINITY_DN997_c0_g1_i2:370-741(-)
MDFDMWIVQQLHHRVDLLLIVVVILRGVGVMECMLRLLRLWYPGSHRCHSLRLRQAREHPSLQRWRVPSSRLFVRRVVLVVLVFRLVRGGFSTSYRTSTGGAVSAAGPCTNNAAIQLCGLTAC